MHVHEAAKRIGLTVAFGLLVKVITDVTNHITDALGVTQNRLGVDTTHFGIVDVVNRMYCIYIINTERQHVFVSNGINNRIRVQFVAKSLLGGFQICSGTTAGVFRKNRRASEAKQVVFVERFGYSGVRFAKLSTVTLVKY